jgi:hypothetical protein
MMVSSFAPTMQDGAFENRIGSAGMGNPDSAA